MLKMLLTKMVNFRILHKSPFNAYLRLNQRIWDYLPSKFIEVRPMRSYGALLHRMVRIQKGRRQFFGTFFLRNRPELELIRRISERKGKGSILRIAILGSSIGAEVYSILWTIRTSLPDLKVVMHAVDISPEVVEFARRGIYPITTNEFTDNTIFERLSEGELESMFDRDTEALSIKQWIKEGIIWQTGDAGDPGIVKALGKQDMVVANNFLCHMYPEAAEKCLRNIQGLLNPGGYIFVSGIDLNVRAKVAHDLGWKPVMDLLKEIHDGDPCLRIGWPCKYYGLEPFDGRRSDWKNYYASAFQVGRKQPQ